MQSAALAGTGEFASRGNLNVAVAVPQFMRAGDEATASIRLSGKPGQVALDIKGSQSLTAQFEPATVQLKKDDETVMRFTLKAGDAGVGQLSTAVKVGTEPLNDLKRVAVRPAAIEETVRVEHLGRRRVGIACFGRSRGRRGAVGFGAVDGRCCVGVAG